MKKVRSSRLWESKFSNISTPPESERPLPPDFVFSLLKSLEEQVEFCEKQLERYYDESVLSSRKSWIEFHDTTGWPDDKDYRGRMLRDLFTLEAKYKSKYEKEGK
jgi:hypothetical protein